MITYTTTLTNNGNTLASNVIFTDVIPNGTSFIPNSVTVNGNTLLIQIQQVGLQLIQ